MQNTIINDIYDRISKILKNDQKYPYETIGKLIVDCMNTTDNIQFYYDTYPALLDIAELGGSLEHASGDYQKETIAQIKYKMQHLRKILPDMA